MSIRCLVAAATGGLLFLLAVQASANVPPAAAGPGGVDAGGRSLVDIDASVVILRPPSEVFAFVSNAENDVHWRSEVVSMKNTTPPPHGIGTRTVEVARVLGRTLQTTTEITEFEPDRHLARRTLQGVTPVNTSRDVKSVTGGSEFRYRLRADVTEVFMFRLLRPVLQWWTQRKVEGYLERLKARLEAPAGANAQPADH